MSAPGWLKGFASKKKAKTSSASTPTAAAQKDEQPPDSKLPSQPAGEGEEDYMCESWLEDSEPAPGLVPETMRGPQKEVVKPLHAVMSAALDQGLSNPLGASNMGYVTPKP